MSGRTYNARANEITKAYYHLLISQGKFNRVYSRKQQDGDVIYFITS
jgi:hypothetical protein